MVQISEVKGDGRQNRTAAHSHIRGLGLKSDGRADKVGAGFVGQQSAREVSADELLAPAVRATDTRGRAKIDKRFSADNFLLGMRHRRRSRQSETDVRTRGLTGWRS